MKPNQKKKTRDALLLLVLERAGGVNALARELGVGKTAVSQWYAVPVRHVEAISKKYRIGRERLLAVHLTR